MSLQNDNVTPLPRVEISDLAKAILALETDRGFIQAEIIKAQEGQRDILRKALDDCADLARQAEWLSKRLAGVDEAIQKLLNAKVL